MPEAGAVHVPVLLREVVGALRPVEGAKVGGGAAVGGGVAGAMDCGGAVTTGASVSGAATSAIVVEGVGSTFFRPRAMKVAVPSSATPRAPTTT